jgi:hypothetical protein
LAAVDVDDGALHPSRTLAAQKRDYIGDIPRLAEPGHAELARRPVYVLFHAESLFASPFFKKLLPALSPDGPGLNEVHVDAVLGTLLGD